ncbi:MAG TPA: hypothetical protein VH394_18175 [Thermoanaerobaculia bacterium]|nr:hypothetical protein [Thermoanaerobaculia bacterium]
MVLDLAIQAAGLVSAPGSGRVLDLPPWDGDGEGAIPDHPAGSVMVGGREVVQEELLAAAAAFQEALAPGDGDREIAVMGRLDRTLLSWSTIYGAALLLAPSPESLVGSAVWARPTVFCGNASEMAAFRRAVEQEKPPFWARKKDRLPFGRLRTVVWIGEGPSDEEHGFWERRGVRVGHRTDVP